VTSLLLLSVESIPAGAWGQRDNEEDTASPAQGGFQHPFTGLDAVTHLAPERTLEESQKGPQVSAPFSPPFSAQKFEVTRFTSDHLRQSAGD
jgi:hypothetical protein